MCERLTVLEASFAEQTREIDKLRETVLAQQLQMTKLEKDVAFLADRLKQVLTQQPEQTDAQPDPLPPHYL